MQPGDVIAERFTVERFAAAGGMGEVYRAIDRHTDGLAALKILRGAEGGLVERFAREARILAELRHPGIVAYLDHGRAPDGALYLAMEWLEGEDLAARLATVELSVDESLATATGAAAALAVAHARGVVHRDVKPSNLFLVDFDPSRVKLLDFGVARLGRLAPLTATGFVVGTPLYMAPEQARGARELDARADVFALGAVLFRCLTGRLPFPADTPAAMVARLCDGAEAPRARSLVPELPAALDELCARFLAKDPAARPRDGAAVLAELLALPRGERGGARRLAAELGVDERRMACRVIVTAPLDAALRAAAAAHGGELEGDAPLVVRFAGPGLPTDHAQRAARFALAVRPLVGDAALALVVRRGGDTLPHGGGPARGVRLDEAAAGLLSARFDVTGDGAALWLLGARGVEHAARPLLGRATALVGRERELALLDHTFDDAVASPAARAVLVTAAAGAGKSRLRQAWLERLGARGVPHQLLAGYGDPMRAGAPFALLGDALRRGAGIDGGEPLEARRALLAARIARVLPAARVGAVAELLGELAGVPFDDDASPALRAARRDPTLLADVLRGAAEEWLLAECAAAPVVLALDDLHWGDLPTVRLLDAVLPALAERPFVLLALARPEVHALFPGLWAERGLAELHLPAVPRRAAERLVRDALHDRIDDAAIAALVERAGGNPFYLEELIRHVAERGGAALPDSVLAMVAARFETLPAGVRRVLRAASVFGEQFPAGGIAALVGVDVGGALAELAEREITTRRRSSRFPGEEEHAFRHSLLREAAYALLTDGDRRLGHRLAGRWLEAAGEREALVLAEHFERGGEWPDAARWYQRAAEDALAGNDPDAAIARAERAVACGAAGEALGEVRLVQAVAQRCRGDMPATIVAAEAAMALLPRGGDAWFRAAGEAAAAHGKLGDLARLIPLLEELDAAAPPPTSTSAVQATAIARAAVQGAVNGRQDLADRAMARLWPLPPQLAGDPAVRGWFHELRSFAALLRGDYPEVIVHQRAAAADFAAGGDARSACLLRLEAAFALTESGEHAEAIVEAEAQLREARRLGLGGALRLGLSYLSAAQVRDGRVDAALASARASLEGLDVATHPRVAAGGVVGLGLALLAAGRAAEAEAPLRKVHALGRAAYPNAILVQSVLARVLAAIGRADEALPLAEAAVDEVLHDAFQSSNRVYVWVALVEAQLAAGRSAAAAESCARARAWIDELSAKFPPERVATFRARVPEVRRLLELAAELAG